MTRKLVLDTNIVLDLFVFDEPAALGLKAAVTSRHVQWIATAGMREELAAVLGDDAIRTRMSAAGVSADDVLRAFDDHACMVDTPVASRIACRDPDDQKFVDLAAAHVAELLSKDKALLALKRKLPVSSGFSQ